MEHSLIFAYHHGYIPDIIDHMDRDISNNKIENLRPATNRQNGINASLNSWNTTGYKGVSYHKATNKWRAYLASKHIGLFETAEQAAEAYNINALAEYGEFAYLNDTKEN